MVCSACCICSFKIHSCLWNKWWLTLLQLYHTDKLIIGHSNACYKTYFNSQRTSHQSSYSFVKRFTDEIDKNKFTIKDFFLITACWKAFLHNLIRPGQQIERKILLYEIDRYCLRLTELWRDSMLPYPPPPWHVMFRICITSAYLWLKNTMVMIYFCLFFEWIPNSNMLIDYVLRDIMSNKMCLKIRNYML